MPGKARRTGPRGPRWSYCPGCFALIDACAERCPACGVDIAAIDARQYRDKLVAALEHPLADVRLRAIIALGLRGEGEAAEPLVRCALCHPTDVVQGLQVVKSLDAIRDTRARERALQTLAAEHRSRLVRAAAARCLQGKRGTRRER